MCLIIDANVAGAIATNPNAADWKPILTWLLNTQSVNRLVIGGKLTAELHKVAEMRRLLVRLDQSGRLRQINQTQIDSALSGLSVWCSSNDHHVLALAVASGARLLCTHDANLTADFKNIKIVPRPKGHVYRTHKNKRLLYTTRHAGACR